jgi:tetratricopeptide (TPR) repeat protein
MSLLGRFLGHSRSKDCAEGVSLLEKGRYAEAVTLLREASLGKSDHPSGSLASFHFRQALVAQGRLFLRSNQPADALHCFSEAVDLWDQYPDLHCLQGAAAGLTGAWDAALAGARAALRRNPDYAEARLLEAVAFQQLDRTREAAESLSSLVESGRRVEHWLINGLQEKERFEADDLPTGLLELLVTSLSGRSEKEEVAAAVARCRAGHWEEGLERFATLVRKRPRYPDYRTRHAAALFHLGRNDEALAEVDAALALNDAYRTAIDLKGLILADTLRLGEARKFLAASDERLAEGKAGSAHEELFGAYLRGVLALLTGRPEEVAKILTGWGGLVRNFAKAELLLAAAEDLLERDSACASRLTALADEWSAEPIYFHLLASHHLRHRRYSEVAQVLGRWPSRGAATSDLRPLYLEGCLAIRQGTVPRMPADLPVPKANPGPEAWRFLEARSLFIQEKDEQAWSICQELVAGGFVTEKVVRLQILAARGAGSVVPEDWRPPDLLPESCLAAAMQFCVDRGDLEAGAQRVERHARVHPEFLTGLWLSPEFWLAPVRNWIA